MARNAGEPGKQPSQRRATGFVEMPGAAVQSLSRGLQIFDYVLAAETPVRSVDVAEHFNIDKSAAYRFLTTLEQHGLLAKNARGKTYTPGARLWQWASQIEDSRAGLVAAVKPIIDDLARGTGHVSHLAVLEANRVMLIDVAASEGLISIRQNAGDLEPLYCSAVGKAIIAFLPDAVRHSMIAQMDLRKHTEFTLATAEALEAELVQIRQDLVAFDRCEGNLEICCIAAPVLGPAGGAVASLGISMPARYVTGGPDAQPRMINLVREAATKASGVLFRG